jgi:hypothetical protein
MRLDPGGTAARISAARAERSFHRKRSAPDENPDVIDPEPRQCDSLLGRLNLVNLNQHVLGQLVLRMAYLPSRRGVDKHEDSR